MKRTIAIILAALLLTGCAAPAQPEAPTAPEITPPTGTVPATEAIPETQPPEPLPPVEPLAIEIETTYDTWDITGDGAPDSLYIQCLEEPEYETWGDFGHHWQILVNWEPALDIRCDWPIFPGVKLYQVSPDRNYFAIYQHLETNDDIADYGLYQYAGGKLEQVCDFYSSDLDGGHIFHYGAELLSLSGDRLLLRRHNQFNATAYLEWDVEYVYADGAWAPTGSDCPVFYEDYMEAKADGMTANQPFTVHSSTACDQAAYEVEKGQVVYIDRLRIENGQIYFHVTNEQGQEGWLKDAQEVYANIGGEDLFGLFEEAMFAG